MNNSFPKTVLHRAVSYMTYVLVNLQFLKILAFWDGPPSRLVVSNYLPADVTYLNLPNHKSAYLLSTCMFATVDLWVTNVNKDHITDNLEQRVSKMNFMIRYDGDNCLKKKLSQKLNTSCWEI
jgi:hypothetical protein